MAFKNVCSPCRMDVPDMSSVVVSLWRLFVPRRSRLNVALRFLPRVPLSPCCPDRGVSVSDCIYSISVCVYIERYLFVNFIYNICNRRCICYIYICGCMTYFSLSTEFSYHVYINKLILLARGSIANTFCILFILKWRFSLPLVPTPLISSSIFSSTLTVNCVLWEWWAERTSSLFDKTNPLKHVYDSPKENHPPSGLGDTGANEGTSPPPPPLPALRASL